MRSPPAIVADAMAEAERGSKRAAVEISRAEAFCAEVEDELQQRKRRLTTEKRQQDLISSLWQKGADSWCGLSNENAWKKAHVLAVFGSAATPLPFKLRESRWSFSAPAAIRDDRDILLARLARPDFDANYYQSHKFVLPKRLAWDKEVIIAVVRHCPKILAQVKDPALLRDRDVFRAYLDSEKLKKKPVDAETVALLGKFSISIRNSAELMLEAAKKLETKILRHCSTSLLSQCPFASHFVALLQQKVPDDTLGRFSVRVRSNMYTVFAFVRKNGRCLRDIGKSLRGNTAIARAACQNDPTALFFCTSDNVKQQLGQDKTLMLDLFDRLPSEKGNPALYKLLPPALKVDCDLVVAAHRAKSLEMGDLPASTTTDRNFWIAVIRRSSMFWRALPDLYANDAVFARSIISFANTAMVEEVFSRFHFLAAEKPVWEAILRSNPVVYADSLFDLMQRFAPEQIRRDKDLMTTACKYNSEVLQLVHSFLLEDEEFVETALKEYDIYDLFDWFPKTAQRLHPHLVVKAFQDAAKQGYQFDEMDLEGVAEELWENPEVCKAYFENGGWFHEFFPETAHDDQQFGLLVAKYADVESFEDATSVALRSNKEFMMKAAQAKPNLLFSAKTVELQCDFDLLAFALDGTSDDSRRIIDELLDEDDDNFALLLSVRKQAQEKIKAYDGVTKGLNRGMSNHAGLDCHLQMLTSGGETTLFLKMQIAEYLGMPTGKEVRLFRRVAENLEWISLSALRNRQVS